MTDKELLELAAKAIGLENMYMGEVKTENMIDHVVISDYGDGKVITRKWNPLEDDGDALRLAVKLEMTVRHRTVDVDCIRGDLSTSEYVPTYMTRGAATRRAIVRAAAEIGRQMP